MKYTIEQLSFIVPAISIGFLFIITSINIYFKIRRRFPVVVNCWFCNENSKIPYDDLNKWTCLKCEQYNGFSEDGDYNCDIPAQRSVKLNKWKTSSVSSMNGSISGRFTPVNGLCEPCNRNQELKVQQLASFEPENEAYFDEEIKEYRHKLEQAYRLCPRCERHLKRTLNKVKTNILGSKLKQMGTKGLQTFDLNLNEKANKNVVYKKRLTFARISLATLILISLLQLFNIANQLNITKSKLDSVFNAGTTTTILTILSYVSAVKILILQLIEYVLQLPYISLAVICAQMAVNYVYTYISGDFWHLIPVEILELVNSKVAESTTNPGSSALTANISGCFLSIFLLFLFGLEWGPVLSLLLWCSNMVMPTVFQSSTDVKHALLMDFAQLTLVWSSVILSMVNFFILPNKQNQSSDKPNSSFHRIDSEIQSDVSDDSDVESELNTSLRSNMSSFSKRSAWNETKVLNSTLSTKAPSLYSANSMRQRPYGISTQSIVSMKPPTDMNNSFASERSFHRSSQLDLTRDRLNASQRSFLASQSPDIFNGRQCPSAMSFHSLNRTFGNGAESLRSPSRSSMYDIPNDFESGITRLNISGDRRLSAQKQSRVFGSSDAFGDALRHRNTVLSPSRLSLNEMHHPGNQSSWLAGGFWNSTSPQKKFPHHTNNCKIDQHTATKEYPIMSRASSKSSGFESRENSLCDDSEMERTFLFSEPAALTQSAKMPADLIKPQPQKPMSLFNGMNGGSYQQPASPVSFISTPTPDPFGNSFSNGQKMHFSTMSRSFDQFSLKQQRHTDPFQNPNDNLSSNQFTLTLNKFNRINKDSPMPTFQRGSLINIHESGTMDH